MSQSAVRQPIPVGKFFLDRGKINEQQLELALKHRAEFGLKLGQSLVELGFVTEGDMVEALRYQARFPCIHLTSGIVEARVAAKVGEGITRRLRALALNQVAGHTTVALEDPSDSQALEELAHVLGTRIFPVYAEPSTIAKLIEQIFGPDKKKLNRTSKAPAPLLQHEKPTKPPRPPFPSSAPGPEAANASAESPSLSEGAPDERAVVESVRGLLQQAFEQEATDIHLEARRDELQVRFRVDGVLREHSRLPGSWTRPTLACLKALAKLEKEETGVPRQSRIPFLFKKQHLEVGLATTPSVHGESAVLHVRGGERRHIPLPELGLSAEQRAKLELILAAPSGLVLVGGPAGSGRTTTLHALLERLANSTKKAVALDTDVGHELDGVLHVEVDPRAGRDYAGGARALLSQDPDLFLVGEIDGREAARCLLQAALSPRVVLSSLRTNDALDALTRLQYLGLEPYLLGEALRGVVAQRLVRRVCSECKTPTVPDEVLRARLALAKDGAVFQEGEGCGACNHTGYRGRVRLFEVLSLTGGLRRELEKGASPETLARAALAEGHQSLRAYGLECARAGLTTLHEVLAATAGV